MWFNVVNKPRLVFGVCQVAFLAVAYTRQDLVVRFSMCCGRVEFHLVHLKVAFLLTLK